jgi:arsenite-transporting ATPase
MKALDRLVQDVLTDDDILAVQTTTRNEEYEKTQEGYRLKVYLPCVKKQDIILNEAGSEIIIRIGNFKRNIPLPDALRKYQISGAKFEEEYLNIQFKFIEGGLENEQDIYGKNAAGKEASI